MNTEWEIPVYYLGKSYQLKAVMEVVCAQYMRIRVHGKKSSMLLETDYPIRRAVKTSIPVKWKLIEGKMDGDPKNAARLLYEIMNKLEQLLKIEYPPLFI